MRRYQVLVESNFPSELNGLFKGLENKGNPWNMSATARMDWAKDLPFDVKVVGEDVESLDEVEWLFWVGCAGAYEDRAKKTTRAVAELLDMAGVDFAVLGNGETCTGDSARRAGNEFVFQGLAAAEHRDLQGVQGQEGRLDLRALLQHAEERVPRPRLRDGGRPPHPAAQPAGPREEADPGRRPSVAGTARTSGRSPTTTPATSVGTTTSTKPRASCSTSSPTPSSSRCRATPSAPSAAAPAVPACGWRRRSAPASTRPARRRPWRPAPTRSPSAARSAG